MKKINVFKEKIYANQLFGPPKSLVSGLLRGQTFLCLIMLLLMVSSTNLFAQTFFGAAGGSILNVDTGMSYTGPGALTLAHDDVATLDGHTLMFMPANLDVFSTDVFDTDHNFTNVTKAVIIDGNGATVTNDNLANTSSALWLLPQSNETITVQNISLCSFTGTTGSAIKSTMDFTGSLLVLTNVDVFNSANNSYAVWLEGSCTVTDCRIGNPLQTSNTGGLYVVLQREQCTATIVNSEFNCNKKVGFGSSVVILDGVTNTQFLHTVNITGGSISNNPGTDAALYLNTGEGSNINIDGMNFHNNDASGTSNASAIYMTRSSGPSQNLFLTNCSFINNDGDPDVIKGGISSDNTTATNCVFIRGTGSSNGMDENNGSVTNSLLYGISPNSADASNTVVTNSATDLGDYNISGIIGATCSGGCSSAPASAPGAVITTACTSPTGVLTSTMSGNWFYQQPADGSPTPLETASTTATIPAGLSGYTVFYQVVGTGSNPVIAFDVTSTVCAVACPATQDFTSNTSVCSGGTITWAAGAPCSGIDGPATPGGGIVVDLYAYAPGGVLGEAPAGFAIDVSAPTEFVGRDDGIDINNPDITDIGGGNYTCASPPTATAITNQTCAPITVTYFTIVFNWNLDTDGDLTYEYEPDCTVERYDVVVYPIAPQVVVTDDGSTCGTPTVVLRAADNTVCATQSGIGNGTAATGVCADDGDVLNYDFTNDAIVTALAGAPAGCQPTGLTGTVTCAGCAAPANPSLTIVKSNSPMGTVFPGDAITYNVTVTNNGDVPLTNIVVSDTAPANTTIINGSAANGTGSTALTVADANVPNGTVASLPVGATAVLTFQVTVDAGTANGTNITNIANVTTTEVPSTDSDPVVNPVQNNPSFTIVKSNNPMGFVLPGDAITYTVTVTNNGDVPLTNLNITDAAPTNTTMVAATVADGGGTATISVADTSIPVGTVANLPVNGTAILTFQVTVDTGTPDGTMILNVAAASSTELPTPEESNQVANEVMNNPSLTIVKSNNPMGTVFPGDAITYTVTVTNNGDVPLTNIVVSDNAPANTTIVNGSAANGTGSTALTVADANVPNGTVATLPVGATAVLTFQVTVDAGTANGTNITNIANVTTTEVPSTDSDPVVNPVQNNPSFTIVKSNNPMGFVLPGDAITYTVTVTNNGDVPLTNLNITDAAPTNTTMVAATVADGGGTATISVADTSVPVGTVANLTVNGTAILTFQVTVDAGTPDGTMILNVAAASSTELPTPEDSNQVANEVMNNPSLTIVKSNSPMGTVFPGDAITYTVTVTNNGDVPLTNIVVSDTAPANTTIVNGSAANGTGSTALTVADANVPNGTVASLPVGATAVLTFQVTVDAGTADGTNITNIANVTTTEVPSTDSDPVVNLVQNNPSFTIVKSNNPTGFVQPGNAIAYTVTITNNGDVPLTNVDITDSAPANTTIIAASVASGGGTETVSIADTSVPVGTVANLPVNGTAILTFQVMVDAGTPDGTMILNTAAANTDELPVDQPSNQVVNEVMNNPMLTIVKSNNPMGDVALGGTITYTVTVTNTGDVPLTNVVVSDAAPTNTTIVNNSVTGNVGTATLTIGDASVPSGTIGSMAIGEVAILVFDVTVNAGVADQTVIPNVANVNTTETMLTNSNMVNNTVIAPILIADKTSTFVDANADNQLNPGEQVDYTIVLTNTGNGDALNVMFSDMIPTGTAYVAGTLMTSQGTVNDNGDPLTGDLGTVAANGGTLTITFSVTINSPFTNASGTIENQGDFTSTNHPLVPTDDPTIPTNDPTDPGDPGDPTVDPVTEPILIADKTSTFVDANADNQLNPSEQVDYTIVLTNTGNGDALNVMFSDMIPTGTAYVAGTLMTSQGTVDDSSDPLTGDLGTVAANGGTLTITFSVTINSPFTNVSGTIENQGDFTSTNHPLVPTDDPTIPTNDPTDPGDPGDPTVDPVTEPILIADKTSTFVDANADNQLNPSEQVDYTIVLTNTGNGDALNVMFSDMIPTGTAYVAGTLMTSQGTVNDNGDPLTGDLGTVAANGGTLTITFSVTINSPFTNVSGTIENQGDFTSTNHPLVPTDDPTIPTNDPTDPGDPGDPTVNPVTEPILIADKTSTFVDANADNQLNPGEQVDYTIVLTNTGNGDALNVMFSDMIPTGTAYVAGTLMTSQGTVNDSGDPLTGDLGTVAANGGTLTITFSVTINSPFTNASGTIENQGDFTSTNHPLVPTDDPTIPTNDPTDPGDPGDPTVDPVAQPFLMSQKTSTYDDANMDGILNPTEQLNYTIVLTNSGPGDALNVTFSDMIPVGTTYVPATLMTSQGTVDDSGDPLTGSLGIVIANGGMVTITFSVTVNNPFTNNPTIIENQAIFNADNHPEVISDDPTDPSNNPMNPGDPADPTLDPVGANIIVLNDPCNCLDNESAASDDGQFMEIITIMGPANQNWVIQSVDGLFQMNSPAPPAAPVTFAPNFALTETVPGTYVLEGIHVDAIGYTVTLTDGTNTVVVPDMGRNTCFYPEGALLGLAASYCADDMATAAVTANLTNNPAGTVTNFEIIGETNFTVTGNTLSFVPSALAAGTYTVRYEFDAEDATVNDPNDPGCMIVLEETFIIDEPLVILCRPPVNINAEENCGVANPGILPPVVIGGGVGNLVVTNNAPAFFPMGTTTVNWTITDGNGCPATCSQTVTVFDNEPPTIDCGNAFYANTSWENCGYPSTLLEGPIVSDNCGILNITNDAPAFFPPGMYMPTWTVTDVNGNTASCMQWVTVNDTTLPKLTSCPEDVEVSAQTADGATATWTQPTAMDNCPGDIIWISTHNSGDFFPLGQTAVVYTAYDQNGQSIDCEFTVTVTPIGDPNVAIAGELANQYDETIEEVEVYINGEMNSMFVTLTDGFYNFEVPFNGDYSITPEKDIDPLNGVSTYDMVLIQKHILGDELLDSPYKMIAADVNKSNAITTLDLVQLRKLILYIDTQFSNNTSWRFISKSFEFADPTNPFGEDFPEVINFNNLSQSALTADFVGVKIGDINGNASVNSLLGADDRTGETILNLQTKNVQMQAGETYEVDIHAADFDHLGMQFTLSFDTEKIAFENIESDLATAESFGLMLLEEGAITVSWFEANSRKLAQEDAIIRLTLTAKTDVALVDVLSINSKYTRAEAYTSASELQTVALNFGETISTNFKLYQNVPNPFTNETFIGFDLPTATAATLTISDISGKVIFQTTDDFAKGYNRIELTKNDLPTTGVWYYQLKTATDFATGKMILINN